VFFRLPLQLSQPHQALRSGRCSCLRVCLFCCTTLVHSSFAATPAPSYPKAETVHLPSYNNRGQPPLIVLLACGSLRANRAVTVFVVAPLWLLPCSLHFIAFTRQRHPTQEPSFNRSFRSTPRLSLPGHMSFPPANHAVAARFRFTPPSFTAPHISPLPFIRSFPLHSLFLSGTCRFQRTRSQKQKLRQPCRNGSRPPPSLSFRAARCQRPCSTRSRLALNA
jgi:hypothetical protein